LRQISTPAIPANNAETFNLQLLYEAGSPYQSNQNNSTELTRRGEK
jgi:hypothetical protein